MDIPELKKPDINISVRSILKKLRPRKRHLRYVWISLVVLAGISFLVGQVMVYVSQALR